MTVGKLRALFEMSDVLGRARPAESLGVVMFSRVRRVAATVALSGATLLVSPAAVFAHGGDEPIAPTTTEGATVTSDMSSDGVSPVTVAAVTFTGAGVLGAGFYLVLRRRK